MTSSRIKSISAFIIAIVLMATSVISVSAAAPTNEYSASQSYKSSKYYRNLSQIELTGDQVTDIITVAKSQVGYHESNSSYDLSGSSSGGGNCTEYGRWFGRQSYWCNVFVSWCAHVAGIDTSIFPKLPDVGNSYYSVLPNAGAECFSFSSGRALEAGDLIFCCTCSGSYGCIDHVGLVVGVDEDTIYTVEGNMSDQVKACQYPASTGYSSYLNARINYVARPNYENNSTKTHVEKSTAIKTTDSRVYILFDESVSYKSAVKLCKNMGGKLANPRNEKELETVSSLVAKGSLNRYFIAKDKNADTVRAATVSGVINTSANRSYTGFICQIDVNKIKPANEAVFNGSRYQIFDTTVTYEIAQAIAEAKGGKLTIVEDSTEAMMLSLLLKEADSYYTGLEGTRRELKKVYNGFSEDTKFKKNNIAVLLNDSSRELSVVNGKDKNVKTGFIVEIESQDSCTLVYDANGGENAPIAKVVSKGDSVKVTNVTPVKKGHVFLGWSTSPNAVKGSYHAGDKVTLKQNVTLYAVWG